MCLKGALHVCCYPLLYHDCFYRPPRLLTKINICKEWDQKAEGGDFPHLHSPVLYSRGLPAHVLYYTSIMEISSVGVAKRENTMARHYETLPMSASPSAVYALRDSLLLSHGSGSLLSHRPIRAPSQQLTRPRECSICRPSPSLRLHLHLSAGFENRPQRNGQLSCVVSNKI